MRNAQRVSSMFSLFTETAPFQLSAVRDEVGALMLSAAPVRWTKTAHMLYLDQPVGTGFSFAPRNSTGTVAHNETQLSCETGPPRRFSIPLRGTPATRAAHRRLGRIQTELGSNFGTVCKTRLLPSDHLHECR